MKKLKLVIILVDLVLVHGQNLFSNGDFERWAMPGSINYVGNDPDWYL